MKKLYRFRIEGFTNFPMALLSTEECWPATIDDSSTITSLLTGDIPTHFVGVLDNPPRGVQPTRLDLLSRTNLRPRRWEEQGWCVKSVVLE